MVKLGIKAVNDLSSSPSQCIIYYLVSSPKLSAWLSDATIQETLQCYTKWHHIERDPQVFSVKIDEDYVHCLQGVTRASFCNVYLEWIQYCTGKTETVDVFFSHKCILANASLIPSWTFFFHICPVFVSSLWIAMKTLLW